MKIPLFLILFLLFILNFIYLTNQVYNPLDTTMPESSFAYTSFEFSKGNEIYKDFREFPFIVSPYPPFYYWFLGTSIKIFNLNKETIFYFGRAVNLLVVILLGIIFFIYLRKNNISLFSSCFSILLLLSNNILFPWAVTLRCDFFALLFSFLAFLFQNKIIFSLIFSVISFFFKPSFVAFPISLFIFYIFKKNLKKALLFFSSYIIIILLIIFFFNLKTKGLFYLNVFEANMAPLKFENFRVVFFYFLNHSFLPLSLGLFGIFLLKTKNIISIYSIISLFFSIFSALKLGSNTNYFLEPLFLFSITSAYGIEKIEKYEIKILFSISIFPLLFNLNTNLYSIKKLNFEDNLIIKNLIENEKGLILTDIPRFSYLSRKPFFIDPFNLNYLEEKGKWSSEKILKLIRKGEIKIFIFSNPIERPLKWQGQNRIPQKILDLLKKETYFYGIVENYFVYFKKQI